MNYSKQDLIRNELNTGERLHWSGEPVPSFFYGGSIVASIFGLFFLGFSIFWFIMASSMAAESFMPPTIMDKVFPFFSVPFMIVGLLILFAPVWTYLNMKNTCYGITSNRCIIISGIKTLKTKTFEFNTLHNIEKIQRVNGTGDIIFLKEYHNTYRDGRRRTHVDRLGFKNIPDVNRVERTLKDCMSKPDPSTSDLDIRDDRF